MQNNTILLQISMQIFGIVVKRNGINDVPYSVKRYLWNNYQYQQFITNNNNNNQTKNNSNYKSNGYESINGNKNKFLSSSNGNNDMNNK